MYALIPVATDDATLNPEQLVVTTWAERVAFVALESLVAASKTAVTLHNALSGLDIVVTDASPIWEIKNGQYQVFQKTLNFICGKLPSQKLSS